ncbi:MAG: GNAT family N-acetyltransferase [Nocardioidaceae bacterium]
MPSEPDPDGALAFITAQQARFDAGLGWAWAITSSNEDVVGYVGALWIAKPAGRASIGYWKQNHRWLNPPGWQDSHMAPAAELLPAPAQRRLRLAWTIAGLLALGTVVASTGWLLAAHEGRGIAPECYGLQGRSDIRFDPLHGSNTERSTFAVAESNDSIMLGYWEQADDAPHMQRGYGSRITYTLTRPLGDRAVVDPAGHLIPEC